MSEGFQEFGLLQRMEDVAGGMPCLRDSGVIVDFLAGLFMAGESIDFIAKQYGRSRDEIEAAIRLVVYARGCNLETKRATAKVARVLPLLRNRWNVAKGGLRGSKKRRTRAR